MSKHPIIKYNTFPVCQGDCYFVRVLVPKDSMVPEAVKPTSGFVLSSRSGPPVRYQIIQTTQNIANAFISIPMYVKYIGNLITRQKTRVQVCDRQC